MRISSYGLALSAAVVLCPRLSTAQSLTVAAHTDPPPSIVAAPVRDRLAAGGARVTSGAATLDFWWVTALPVTGSGDASWARVPEGSLVGAVQVSAPYRDIRGRTIKPGVYTLRYGVQPANGDHLGVSPHREFLLIVPASEDKDPAPTGHDPTVELAKKTIGTSHPAVWSLDPPVAHGDLLSLHQTDAGHQTVVFEVPLAGGGALRFGLVLVGKIEA